MKVIKKDKYEAGDKVLIKSHIEDKYIPLDKKRRFGRTIVTIYACLQNNQHKNYVLKEVEGYWVWSEYDIKGMVVEDIYVGDYVLFKNTNSREIGHVKHTPFSTNSLYPRYTVIYGSEKKEAYIDYSKIIDVAKLKIGDKFQPKNSDKIHIVIDYEIIGEKIVYVDSNKRLYRYNDIQYLIKKRGPFTSKKYIGGDD